MKKYQKKTPVNIVSDIIAEMSGQSTHTPTTTNNTQPPNLPSQQQQKRPMTPTPQDQIRHIINPNNPWQPYKPLTNTQNLYEEIEKQGKPQREVIPKTQLYTLADRIQEEEAKTAYYLMALTGQRIGEALATRKQDIKIETIDDEEYLTVYSITLKNKKQPDRNITTPYKNPEDKPIIDKLLDWSRKQNQEPLLPTYYPTNTTQKNKQRKIIFNRFRPLEFKCRAKQGRNTILEHATWVNPHYLRSCRFTYWVNEYGIDALALMYLAGWTDTRPALHYIRLSKHRIAKMMR